MFVCSYIYGVNRIGEISAQKSANENIFLVKCTRNVKCVVFCNSSHFLFPSFRFFFVLVGQIYFFLICWEYASRCRFNKNVVKVWL